MWLNAVLKFVYYNPITITDTAKKDITLVELALWGGDW